MPFDPKTPYNDLPPLPPPVEVETRAVLKAVTGARTALAELKGLGATIPNQALLVDSLVLQEARASSEIENIVTTSDAIYQAFVAKSPNVDPATKEVLRYREALWKGFNTLQQRPVLSTALFVDVVQTIIGATVGIRTMPGTVVASAGTGQVIYTPPDGERVIRDHLRALETYIHAEDDSDPLVRLALVHYQFEAIHPFSDGNGRTGRIINILFLVQRGLLDLPVLYLSKFIIDNRSEYYRLLRGVTERGAWEPWILYMLRAVEDTATLTRDRILAIRSLMHDTMEAAKQSLPPRVYSKELIETVFRQPYTKVESLVEAGIAKRQTAADYLHVMEKAGLLQARTVGRETLYLNLALFALLSR